MPPAPDVRAVLFDFFGTLVTHQANRPDLDYSATALLVHQWGYANAGERFAEVWNAVSQTLELSTSGSLEEFSMDDVVDSYDQTEQLGLTGDQRDELLASFMREWSAGVRPIAGVNEMLAALATTMRVGIVSNSHDPALVPGFVERFGLGAQFDPIVLSVAHGNRKPHRSIYTAAFEGLAALADLRAEEVLFVGDTYLDDYVGPLAAGFQARLIDPHRRHPVPDHHRLTAILDLPRHL